MEFQFGKMKSPGGGWWWWLPNNVNALSYHLNWHLNMVKMATFMLFIFYHDFFKRWSYIPACLEQFQFISLAWHTRWLSGKESTCQFRRLKRLGFDPCVAKIPWSRKWQPTAVFLPGKVHGLRSLVGYILWGHSQTRLSTHVYTYSILGNFFLLLFFNFLATARSMLDLMFPDLGSTLGSCTGSAES